MSQLAIPCVAMRGGTSKGLYFRSDDLPADEAERNSLLLAAMGSPDARQIDGMGGAHPLTSKVAIVGPATCDDADVDYLFLQVAVEEAEVRTTQNCGNILAGVGPFAIEQGLVEATDGKTRVRIHMVNSGTVAVASIMTPGGEVTYEGDVGIQGVPGTAAPVVLEFLDVAGASCGSLLPTGHVVDTEQGIRITCIDNGMPVVLVSASDLGKTGAEGPQELESDAELRDKLEAIRLAVGPRMNLGDVTDKTVPKMCLVSAARHGGLIATQTFIPHRVHDAIGVLGAASVAAACLIHGSIAQQVSGPVVRNGIQRIDVEHPSGFLTVEIEVDDSSSDIRLRRSSLLRTARKLMQGDVFVTRTTRGWNGC